MGEIRAGGHVIGEHGWEPLTVSELREIEGKEYPGDFTVEEVLDYVGDDKALAETVLASEKAGKDRKTLTAALEAVAAAEDESEAEEEPEAEAEG